MPVRRPWRLGAAFTLILGTLLRPASATSELTGGNPCGDNGVCAVPLGTYRLLLPPSGEVRGVYVFFHGFQSSATEAVRDRRLTETLFAHGLALAAPESIGRTWSHPNATTADRDDIAFSGQILDDLADWLGFTGERVILGGFSRGASMAWYAACAFGERVGGVVTFSGVFWEPLPTAADCPGAPPPFVHIHGRADTVFPLEGRAARDGRRRGGTFESIGLLRTWAACSGTETFVLGETGTAPLFCERATGCARGPITLCLHDRGHTLTAEWLDEGLRLLEEKPRSGSRPG